MDSDIGLDADRVGAHAKQLGVRRQTDDSAYAYLMVPWLIG